MRRLAACMCLSMITVSCAGRVNPPPNGPVGHDPYAYTTPTPPPEPTPIDGIYARMVTAAAVGGVGDCRRCPPYRLAVGVDVLGLENGVFEVYHRGSGYVSVGHYTTGGSGLTLFNDPNCPTESGTYRLEWIDERWSFSVVEDSCAYDDVRSRFLTAVPWTKIEPPDGIYTSAGGDVLELLNSRFVLESSGVAITGTATRVGNSITITGPGCAQEFEWSAKQRTMTLAVRKPICRAAWVTDLAKTHWAGVG